MPDNELRVHIDKWKSASANQWGMMSLSRDPLARLFSEDQKKYIIEKSIACGREKADELIEKNGPFYDPERIASQMGIKITSYNYPIAEKRHILFAQYENHEITYAKGVVDRINQLMEEENLYELLDKFAPVSVIIAHEVFHCIEDENADIMTRKIKIPIKFLKYFTQHVTPIMAGEIGAFTFAQTLLGLAFDPRIVEMLGFWGFNPEHAKALTINLLQYEV